MITYVVNLDFVKTLITKAREWKLEREEPPQAFARETIRNWCLWFTAAEMRILCFEVGLHCVGGTHRDPPALLPDSGV